MPGALNTPAPIVLARPPPPPQEDVIEDMPAAARIRDTPGVEELTIDDLSAATVKDMTPEEMDDLFGKIKDKVTGGVGDAIGELKNAKNKIAGLQNELQDAMSVLNKIKDFIVNFPNVIKNEVLKIVDKVKDVVNDALKEVKGAFAWVGKIKDFWNRFKGWIISVACTVVLVCSAAILGPFIMPLLSGLSALRSAGSTFANTVK